MRSSLCGYRYFIDIANAAVAGAIFTPADRVV
jgi:hypothetical protein